MTQENPIPPGYEDVSVPIEAILASAKRLALALLLAPLIAYWLIHGFQAMFDYGGRPALEIMAILLVAFIIAVVVHEGLHALGWIIFSRISWREIRFGFDAKNLAPYAHAQVPMKATAYRIGAALPGIALGLLPALVGIINGDGILTIFGAIMLSAAVGDVFVLWIIRTIPSDALVLDHPSQAGCMVKITD